MHIDLLRRQKANQRTHNRYIYYAESQYEKSFVTERTGRGRTSLSCTARIFMQFSAVDAKDTRSQVSGQHKASVVVFGTEWHHMPTHSHIVDHSDCMPICSFIHVLRELCHLLQMLYLPFCF